MEKKTRAVLSRAKAVAQVNASREEPLWGSGAGLLKLSTPLKSAALGLTFLLKVNLLHGGVQ